MISNKPAPSESTSLALFLFSSSVGRMLVVSLILDLHRDTEQGAAARAVLGFSCRLGPDYEGRIGGLVW